MTLKDIQNVCYPGVGRTAVGPSCVFIRAKEYSFPLNVKG